MTVTYGPGVAQIIASHRVECLERELLLMPQADIKTIHSFEPSKYLRTIIVPPQVALTGAVHKVDYEVYLEKGTIQVTTDTGLKELIGPCRFPVKAGHKRAGFTLDNEVTWTDIYPNPDDCRDILELENRLYFVPSIGLADSRIAAQRDIIDYNKFLHEFGLTHSAVAQISQITSDLAAMPPGIPVALQDSPIHGKGLFAMQAFSKGSVICPGRLQGKRTPAGRYINHSANPNVIPIKVDDDIYVHAVKDIAVGDELLVDYRESMRVNFGLKVQGELV